MSLLLAAKPIVTDWITAIAAIIAAAGTVTAAVAAWRSARASGKASQTAADALAMQTEREAALTVDDALRALEVDAQSSGWPDRLGEFHNRWQDGAGVPAMRLRDAETRRRVAVVGHVLFLAMQAAKNEHTSYAFLAAIEDARAALNALLQNTSPGASGFPSREMLDTLCPIGTGGRSFDALNIWLEQHFPGFRQL